MGSYGINENTFRNSGGMGFTLWYSTIPIEHDHVDDSLSERIVIFHSTL